ncbi:type VI secretion system baseplate subunit TssK [Rugamonas sp.]|uniref:type VI secretion system baseplate subunit TssK n=1 Tax=Rugamonas sp. TaxID=1926287 RepID=UPI0025EFA9F3|nr:type VI secretion system baseplate subunit TssK [Rugamonas sp.]
MSRLLKVLWAEGLNLEAQHFQQSDRYHEARLRHIASAVHPFAWGVQLAQWNIAGVPGKSLSALALTLIFEDGEVYQAPDCDDLPAAVDLSKLPDEAHSVVFYAALPVLKAHGGNLASAEGARDDMRYAPVDALVPDLYTDGLNINVSYMKKTLRLLAESDTREAHDCLPVARVRRTVDGNFEIDPTFMAPSLSVHADPAMQLMLRTLLGKLSTKVETLSRLQRQPRGSAVEARGDDASSFWMLSTINTANAALTHCAKLKHCHPVDLFEKMTTLAGGLMTFSRKYAVTDLPDYNHEKPGHGFDTLSAIIGELLDIVASSKYVTIPLARDPRTQYFMGQLDSKLTEGKAVFYLAVGANMPALNLVAEAPRQLKIASPHDIVNLVRLALSGLQLVHLAQVPMEVPVRPDTHYFSIKNQGALYEAAMKARAITIFAPSTLTELRLELFAITE